MFVVIILFALSALVFTFSAINQARERRREREFQEYIQHLKRIAVEDKARQRREAAERKAANKAKKAEAAAAREAEREKARQERAANAAAREEANKAKQLEKLENARKLAEYKERAARAERELRGKAAVDFVPEQPAQNLAPAAAVTLAQFAAEHAETASGNAAKPFQGETVSFTGTLSSMTRAQAIERVKQAGGKAYKDMPAGTTLLVVGNNPGEKKQALYDKWIGQCHKITEAQFLKMLEGV